MIKKFLNPGSYPAKASLGLFVLRVTTSALMLTHGWPKFQRLLAGNMRFGDPIGLGSELSFVLVVTAEFLCSILLILGLFSRLASIPPAIAMLVAFSVTHADDPFGTQEKPILYFMIYIVLFITGPGKYSLDKKLYN